MLHESSEEDSYPLCSIEEISDVNCLETMDLRDVNVRPIMNSEHAIRKLRSCEKMRKSGISQDLSRDEGENENKKVFQDTTMIRKAIYIVAGHQRECTSKMKHAEPWNDDNKKKQRRQIRDAQQENIKTVREGSDDSDKVNQALSRQFGQVQCKNNKFNDGNLSHGKKYGAKKWIPLTSSKKFPIERLWDEDNMNIKQTNYHEHQERANTVRGGSGGKVAKNVHEFFHQLMDINEAFLRQRTHGHVAKTRDRDLSNWHKQQKNASGALPQVHSQQCGQAKRTTTNETNLSCELNNGNENCKTLTDCNIELRPSKILKRACVNSKISDHLIGVLRRGLVCIWDLYSYVLRTYT